MTDEFLIHLILVTVTLLLVASVSAIILKKFNFPYTIGLVIVGIISAILIHYSPSLSSHSNVVIFHNIIYYLLLPVLIFDASLNMDSRLLIKNIAPILVLAVPGLIISMLIVGICVHLSVPLGLGAALLFGALISATDPVAVIALFKEIGAPKRLTMLVDGESIFNDATAIVAFNIVFAIVAAGKALDTSVFMKGALNFLIVFAGGTMVGFVIGLVFVLIMKFARRDPMITIYISVIIAYAAFITADHFLKVSGVMSVLGAGIVVNWFGNIRLTEEIREELINFWEFSAFAANSFIFLILGLVEWKLVLVLWKYHNLIFYLVFTILSVVLARAVVVYGLIPLLSLLPKQKKIGKEYKAVIFWGGLRGAVPLALAFSLKPDIQENQLILVLTLGVVLFTLLAQGISTKFLIKIFKLDKLSVFESVLCLQTRFQSLSKGKEFLLKLKDTYNFKRPIEEVITNYESSSSTIAKKIAEFQKHPDFNENTLKKLLWYQVVAIEKKSYKKLLDRGLISESVYMKLEQNIEAEKDHIREGQSPALDIEVTPLEELVKKFSLFIVERFLPSNRFSKWIKYKNILMEYETTLAEVAAYREISKTLETLHLVYFGHENFIDDCREFYRMRADKALHKRKEMERYISVFNLQSKYLQKAALVRELEAIEKLFNTGHIPKSVSDVVKKDISDEMLSL